MKRLAILPLAGVAVVGAAYAGESAALHEPTDVADSELLEFGGNPQKGWDLFRSKKCISCHAVWGEGGDVGSDLGRVGANYNTTAGQLAGTMWNHIPRMWEKMEEQNIRVTDISPEEMSHLFAFLLFIRYVDEPGNAEQGERVLHRYRCDSCHAIGGQGGAVGPDLERWARFVNPIVWAQKMWDHAEEMEAQMAGMGIGWPKFEPRDLVNIIAYIRSRGIGESKEYIEPGSPSRGQEIFGARGCETCHKIGGGRGGTIDLNEADLPETLAGIASRMWNHAPAMQRAMRRESSPATSIEAQEMADVIAYVLTRRYYAVEGDPKRGAQVFAAKGCSTCHALGNGGGGVGPDLGSVCGNASPVFMAYVMWRWGPTMTAEMTRRGLPWPSFSDDEMTDLIAFFDQPRDSTEED